MSKKKAVILHAMEQSPTGHWYKWLKNQLEDRGYEAWVPSLPHPDHPDAKEMTQFLLDDKWDFNENLLIGHSSGAVEILHLLQNLPEGTKVETAVLTGAFSKILWEDMHKDLFTEPFDFEKIKKHANKFLFVHGTDDPWCPAEQVEYLTKQTDGDLVMIEGGGHFSTTLNPKYTEFPELVGILEKRMLI